MHRVQCLDCRHILSGRRHSYTHYVYCESCCRYKLQRLQGQIDTLRAAALEADQRHKDLRLASQKATFLSTWTSPSPHGIDDPFLPVLSDVALLPPDGPCVLAHRAVLGTTIIRGY